VHEQDLYLMGSYLVTGGCGFIGSHLADALIAGGHLVRILDDMSTGRIENKPAAADLIEGDVADPVIVARAMRGMDGCFHLAAIASVERSNLEWRATHRTNLTGSITVFDAARRAKRTHPIPVVYASSAAVYGQCADVPLRETSVTRPLSAYGADKLGSELHGAAAWHVHGVPTTGLRFFNVYGPRQDPTSAYSGVISIFCDRLVAGRPITLYGDGGQSRDFVFVRDIVGGLTAAMRRATNGASVYNLCTGRSTTILELAATIAEVIGVRPHISFAPERQGDIKVSCGDPSKAKVELGFSPDTTLPHGLMKTLSASLPTSSIAGLLMPGMAGIELLHD
jgi:UDP-glucose 4-epimerase